MKPKTSKSAAEARAVDVIGDFYTNHPYPPPVENLDRARDMWRDENDHRAEYHLFWPHKQYRADFDVLVAGCGTWQAAKFALCHPAARVFAIDISRTSLEHTERLKQKHDLDNLETRQLPIENVANLHKTFDLIVSTGVLHHLVDPDAGLRALSSILRAEGAMYLMVYAPYGRTGVSMFQEYCRKLRVDTSQQEINDLTAVLQTLPQYHPLLSMLRGSRESLRADALVDAVLNPRDRTYSVAQLSDFLEGAGLALRRWSWQAAYLPQCGSISETPHAARLAALPEREQYAAMELLRGLITNHEFVAYRRDENDHAAKVGFDNEDYLRYVPIRRPWTMCVQEQLPPGAAGALLNQTHLFDDLFLFINTREKELYDSIDGRRSISEIVEKVDAKDSQHAREFFEKLWRYDQVVFDTSQCF